MNTQLLEQKIAQKDADAVGLARQIGSAADPLLARCLSDSDPEVREIAVACVDAIGGPSRDERLVGALEDKDINVRSVALRFLRQGVGKASLPALLRQVQTNGDSYVRGEAALIIGRLDDRSAVGTLQTQARRESDPDAKSNQILAIARLGDDEARHQIQQELRHSEPQTRFSAVQKYEYIGDPRALRDLRPVLEDYTEVLNIRPSHLGRYYLRLCDIAVQVVTRVGKPPFPFDGTERRRFTAEELSQVAKWIGR